MLGLAPLTIAIHFLVHPGSTLDFVLAALSLVPLAWLIGEATEHAAHHTGPGIGGFLNATFGNAPELIIALFAVYDGLIEVVRGSLTGAWSGTFCSCSASRSSSAAAARSTGRRPSSRSGCRVSRSCWC